MAAFNPKPLEALLTAHACLLNALVQTHPDKVALRAAFDAQMASALDMNSGDPELAGTLESFEEALRKLMG